MEKWQPRQNASKRLFLLHAKSDKKAIRSLPSLFPSPFLQKSFFECGEISSRKGRLTQRGEGGKKITMLTNKPVGHQCGSDHSCFLNHDYISQLGQLKRTKRTVHFKILKNILGLFLDLPWHLPSLPTTTGCPQD